MLYEKVDKHGTRKRGHYQPDLVNNASPKSPKK